jgi:GNAT superfamily N-acetyltransferase
VALSTQAGWNQTALDWRRLFDHAVCLGVRKGDRVIATTTLMIYGPEVAWIGMVLVDEDHRGKGHARRLLDEAIERVSGITAVKLDATPLGEPVYRKLGFEPLHPVYRCWVREANLAEAGWSPAGVPVPPGTRPGRVIPQWGPCYAGTAAEANAELAKALEQDPVLQVDAYAPLGEVQRTLTRMVKGRNTEAGHARAFALAGFEWG